MQIAHLVLPLPTCLAPRHGTHLPARHCVRTMSAAAGTVSDQRPMAELVPGFLGWIDLCNNGVEALRRGDFVPFVVDGATVGYLAAG